MRESVLHRCTTIKSRLPRPAEITVFGSGTGTGGGSEAWMIDTGFNGPLSKLAELKLTESKSTEKPLTASPACLTVIELRRRDWEKSQEAVEAGELTAAQFRNRLRVPEL